MPKIGDRIEVIEGEEESILSPGDIFALPGEKATIVRIDSDGDLWADFNENNRVLGDGIWCLEKMKYKVIEECQH